MAYITDKKLGSVIDIPICLPAVELLQGDWLVVASIKLISPMRLTYRHLTAQLLTITGSNPPFAPETLDYRDLTASNQVSPSLGLASVGLFFNYNGGQPGQTANNGAGAALDAVVLYSVQTVARTAPPIIRTDPGVYSIVVANNMKPSAVVGANPGPEVSIDFKLLVTGSIRLELHPT